MNLDSAYANTSNVIAQRAPVKSKQHKVKEDSLMSYPLSLCS